ncbi:GNAT family N-acetyltransferase [Alicyclobacillus mengziensis]|uniref:GNAT family N-acetyltransferase n=1 Tax=Alicyclobacillus mengziensis TaxID=2931921 RepID=A0A9X7W1H2_9BACL|nr:GNAT family N-acetyltransferase [Alicyclobacillus mengziensis]QSO48580.1 GNAT family N-acetyltransferase [Alicyclobacillus mengziensis]
MSGKDRARTTLIWITVVLTVVTLVVYVVTVFTHRSNPVWNRALLTYCGVFWVFLAFDGIGRQVAAIGAVKRTAPARPRPQPQPNMPLPGVVGVKRDEAVGPHRETRLERVDGGLKQQVQHMVDDCVKEVLALEGEVPRTEYQAVFDVDDWLRDDKMYAFIIRSGDEIAGVVALAERQSAYEILLIYVRQDLRRQHIGQSAFLHLEEFARLLGLRSSLMAYVSQSNMRGQRFYQSVGMTTVSARSARPEGQVSTGDLVPVDDDPVSTQALARLNDHEAVDIERRKGRLTLTKSLQVLTTP